MTRWLVSRIRFRRTQVRFAVALLLLGLVSPQAWAWYHLRAARAALAIHHTEQARQSLALCLGVWGGSADVHLLASRAARQDGDLETADRELRACQRLSGGATAQTAFEWALLQASAGNVREVEEYLSKAAGSTEMAPLVWEALAEGYLRVYRTPEAMACLNLWLKGSPDDVRALELRGRTFVTGKGVVRGADDYRRVLTLDPTRKQTRWRLIECLINLGTYEEAASHLELFLKEQPDDPEVVSGLARCYNVLNRRDEARQLLDSNLAKFPENGPCLRIRGQLAMTDPNDPQKAQTETYLRRAAEAMPEDYQAQWLLAESLRQQGKEAEWKEQSRKAEGVKDRLERLGELRSRKLADQPLDPALHYEMGMLLLRTGRTELGERWLQTALDLDPNHKLTHAALADYFESRGDKARAEEHRRKSTEN